MVGMMVLLHPQQQETWTVSLHPHEEADTHMVLHIFEANPEGYERISHKQ